MHLQCRERARGARQRQASGERTRTLEHSKPPRNRCSLSCRATSGRCRALIGIQLALFVASAWGPCRIHACRRRGADQRADQRQTRGRPETATANRHRARERVAEVRTSCLLSAGRRCLVFYPPTTASQHHQPHMYSYSSTRAAVCAPSLRHAHRTSCPLAATAALHPAASEPGPGVSWVILRLLKLSL